MAVKTLLLVFLVLGGLSALLLCYFFPELYIDPEVPEIADEYFGRGKPLTDPKTFPKDNPAVKKFAISIPNSVLKDLKQRLNNTKYLEAVDNVEFQYGFHASYLKEVVNYWKDKYDWRQQEKELNKFSHYITQIEGINVHFIHEKPKVNDKKIKVYPLLMVHGWPGSIVEFTKILPLLTTPRSDRDYVFEVICPSIPGYGFSEAPHQPGFAIVSASRIFSKLMDRLGFSQFYAHGGDWGSAITSAIGIIYPNRTLGTHVTMAVVDLNIIGWLKYGIGYIFPSLFMTLEQAAKLYPPSKVTKFLIEETGYLHIQSTKPDTVGAALSDSPAGLAAYILEKFSTWTDPNFRQLKDGGITKKFSLDDLLTNVMIYWTSNSITSSMRLYKESMSERERKLKLTNIPITVPIGIAAFPNEIIFIPKSLIQHKIKNIVRYTLMPRGGHFPALEEPVLLSNEIWDFIIDVENSQKKQ